MQWANFFHIYQPPAWDEDIVRRATDQAYRPMLEILKRHRQLKITLNITAALTEQLVALGMTDVLNDIKALMTSGQIELVASAAYHPILPLLPPSEIERQIDLQDQMHRRIFGNAYHPKGFFPPEMAFGPALEKVLIDRGYDWVLLDEPAGTGDIGQINFSHRYHSHNGLGVVFRHRPLSDFLSFSAVIDQPEQAIHALQSDPRANPYLITAMDGENLGHHRPGVDHLWEALVSWPDTSTMTISEYRRQLKQDEMLEIHASSWSSQPSEIRHDIPYGLWNHPENPIHRAQWELTHLIINTVNKHIDHPDFTSARRLLDQALTSDKYWWASASPWWDAAIVIRETQKLADVIAPLTDVQPSVKNKAERLMKQVATTTELWDTTGLAKRRQATYLESTHAVHFMGGQQVTSGA